MNKEKTDFTQGSILSKLFWFMVPILGALILQAAYGAVDLLVVGRFGSTSGLSAVSTGSSSSKTRRSGRVGRMRTIAPISASKPCCVAAETG